VGISPVLSSSWGLVRVYSICETCDVQGTYLLSAIMPYIVSTYHHKTIPTPIPITLVRRDTITLLTGSPSLNPRVLYNFYGFEYRAPYNLVPQPPHLKSDLKSLMDVFIQT